MYKILTVLATSIMMLTACSEEKPVLTEGETATVVDGAYVAIDEDAYDKLMDMVNAKNNVGIMGMIANGEAALLMEGEEVTVVEAVAGYHLSEVMLSDGTDVIISEDELEQ